MNHRQSDVHNFLKDRISPYPAYKDSGIEWLGRIPVHWEVAATKRLCHIINGGTPKSSEPRYWYGEVTWITPEDLGNLDKRNILSSKRKITSDGQQNSSATIIPAGSLVLSTRAPIGHIGIAGVNLCTNQGCRGLVMRHECSEVYHYFQFLAYRTALEELGQGSTFSELSTDSLGSFRIALPPLSEQRAIAAFLDRETAKIDALVAKKERLIELLQEKRVALISHAVTRGLPADAAAQAGLDPNVPMKDSGVEWIGEIPAHWEVKRVNQISEILRGRFTHRPRNDPTLYDGPYPFVQTGDVTRARKEITGYRQTLNERGLSTSKMFPSGTLVMTIAANIGDVAVLDFAACFPDSVVGFVPRSGIKRDFLFYIFLAMKPELLREAPVNTQGNLNIERIGSIGSPIPVPNQSEQRAIAAFLDCETAKIDALVDKVREAIDRLRELRQALISAAVTGKIDVREAPALTMRSGNSTADGSVMPGASGGMGRHDETRRNDL